jgi:hypothetical protein
MCDSASAPETLGADRQRYHRMTRPAMRSGICLFKLLAPSLSRRFRHQRCSTALPGSAWW